MNDATMTKADLVEEVIRITELPRKESEAIVETIFDTLNAKAAFFAIQEIFDERGLSALPFGREPDPGKRVVPIMALVALATASKSLTTLTPPTLPRPPA